MSAFSINPQVTLQKHITAYKNIYLIYSRIISDATTQEMQNGCIYSHVTVLCSSHYRQTRSRTQHFADYLNKCQQVLLIITYLYCLVWLLPKKARQGHRRRRSWLNYSETQKATGDHRTCQRFYIFIKTEVLLSCLCCPKGQAIIRSLQLVTSQSFVTFYKCREAKTHEQIVTLLHVYTG